MSDNSHPTAALLIIGNEILSGRTEDKNLNYIAKGLNEKGIRFMEVRVVPDIEEVIVEAVNELRGKYNYLFTTGGIGPTHDDITAECIAKAFGVELKEDKEALRRLMEHYEGREDQFNEARRRMANVPEGGELIDNPISAAPGFKVDNVYVFAGVPVIMQAMFDQAKHNLEGGIPIKSRTVNSNAVEGDIAPDLRKIDGYFPDVEIGSYPYVRGGKLGVSIVLRSIDDSMLNKAEAKVKELIQKHGRDII